MINKAENRFKNLSATLQQRNKQFSNRNHNYLDKSASSLPKKLKNMKGPIHNRKGLNKSAVVIPQRAKLNHSMQKTSMFFDKQKGILDPVKLQKLREFLSIRFNNSSNSKINVMNQIGSFTKLKNMYISYTNLTPPIKSLIQSKSNELRKLLLPKNDNVNISTKK